MKWSVCLCCCSVVHFADLVSVLCCSSSVHAVCIQDICSWSLLMFWSVLLTIQLFPTKSDFSSKCRLVILWLSFSDEDVQLAFSMFLCSGMHFIARQGSKTVGDWGFTRDPTEVAYNAVPWSLGKPPPPDSISWYLGISALHLCCLKTCLPMS